MSDPAIPADDIDARARALAVAWFECAAGEPHSVVATSLAIMLAALLDDVEPDKQPEALVAIVRTTLDALALLQRAGAPTTH